MDEHIPKALVSALQRRGIDALRPQDIGRSGLSDDEQLEWALSESRMIVTFDHDFVRLAARGRPHAGIAYCHQDKYSIGELVGLLVLLYETASASDAFNRVEFL